MYKRLTAFSLSLSPTYICMKPTQPRHNLIQSSVKTYCFGYRTSRTVTTTKCLPPSDSAMREQGRETGRTGVTLISQSLSSSRIHHPYHSFDTSNIYSFMLVEIVLFLLTVFPLQKINLIAQEETPPYT